MPFFRIFTCLRILTCGFSIEAKKLFQLYIYIYIFKTVSLNERWELCIVSFKTFFLRLIKIALEQSPQRFRIVKESSFLADILVIRRAFGENSYHNHALLKVAQILETRNKFYIRTILQYFFYRVQTITTNNKLNN